MIEGKRIFDEHLDELAEFVGILLGDGSLSLHEDRPTLNNRLKISFNAKEDSEYIGYVKNLIVKVFGVEPVLKYRKCENTADLYLFKKDILLFLTDDVGLKLSPKWERAVIPDIFLRNGLELRILRGYFDTDGCVVRSNNNGTIYPRLEMKICPSPMQSQFISILRNYCFRLGVYECGNGEVRIQMNGKKLLKKWIEEIGFSNPSKKTKALLFDSPIKKTLYIGYTKITSWNSKSITPKNIDRLLAVKSTRQRTTPILP